MFGKTSQSIFYNLIWKRTSTTALFVGLGALAFERIVDRGVDTFWDNYNKGRQFKDIEPIYRENGWLKEQEEE
ncbi:hypothetical protein C9374_003067 [Naegleria lovaniensis]|uniref:Complex III subunit 9 n=1 Tax=Naegleria lovaniensis TaxID=51637 RepID=A0AA88GTU8_NAELO|nr:uncharacterized protein C9374_003067 [Naegleria lovaniensis]KAG2385918.1 hypothetical protein C9374_003067 [Naegleria lovaniensis]